MKENVKVMYRVTPPSKRCLKDKRKEKLALKTVTIKKKYKSSKAVTAAL